MENENNVENMEEVQVVPDGYYNTVVDSLAFNNFALSLLLGMLIVFLMITGMKK